MTGFHFGEMDCAIIGQDVCGHNVEAVVASFETACCDKDSVLCVLCI